MLSNKHSIVLDVPWVNLASRLKHYGTEFKFKGRQRAPRLIHPVPRFTVNQPRPEPALFASLPWYGTAGPAIVLTAGGPE